MRISRSNELLAFAVSAGHAALRFATALMDMPDHPHLHPAHGSSSTAIRGREEARLLRAHRRLRSARARIAAELTVIAKLDAAGLDTPHSTATLRRIKESLRLMAAYEDVIEEMLTRHGAEAIARAAIDASLARVTVA